MVKKYCKEVFTVDRKKQWSPQVVIKTAISPLPFLLAGHSLLSMKKIIAKLLKEKTFDVIHVETFYVMQNIPVTSVPIVLVEHNIEYSVYQRFVDTAPFLLKPLLQIDVEKIKHFEKKSWQEATMVVGVSQIEAKQMRSDARVVANGVSLVDFPYKEKMTKKDRKTVLFMGDFTWIQNRDTALWILKEIWPKIEKKMNVKLWIVGKHIPDVIKEYASTSIQIDENAPNKTSEIYKKTDLLLAPIRVGGGTSYKILEAMASGVPVVTTNLGVEGLGAKNSIHALVGKTAEDLSQYVLSVLKNARAYENIRKNAREFIEKNYSWKEIAKQLERVYKDAIKK